jgi:hypothetical protein
LGAATIEGFMEGVHMDRFISLAQLPDILANCETELKPSFDKYKQSREWSKRIIDALRKGNIRIFTETGIPLVFGGEQTDFCAAFMLRTEIQTWLDAISPGIVLAPESNEPPPFRPHVGWQIALFDAWLAICKSHGGRHPTSAEAIRYLRKNDTSGTILPKTDGGSLWWKPQRGEAKEVALKTVENIISGWRSSGVLPA